MNLKKDQEIGLFLCIFHINKELLFVFSMNLNYNMSKGEQMDYRDFTPRNVAYDGFIKLRRQVLESADRGDFADVFSEICANAMVGDCVAQDVVAYFFNKGVPDFLPENYDCYMSWQILAGANGNEFALEKLEFFLNPALEPIVDDETILTTAMQRGTIDKDNALMVISNLICEGVVDELKIDAQRLIKFNNKNMQYSPKLNRTYLDAIEKSIPKVVNYLMS